MCQTLSLTATDKASCLLGACNLMGSRQTISRINMWITSAHLFLFHICYVPGAELFTTWSPTSRGPHFDKWDRWIKETQCNVTIIQSIFKCNRACIIHNSVITGCDEFCSRQWESKDPLELQSHITEVFQRNKTHRKFMCVYVYIYM